MFQFLMHAPSPLLCQVEKIPGGELEDSCVMRGVMLNKDVTHSKMRRRYVWLTIYHCHYNPVKPNSSLFQCVSSVHFGVVSMFAMSSTRIAYVLFSIKFALLEVVGLLDSLVLSHLPLPFVHVVALTTAHCTIERVNPCGTVVQHSLMRSVSFSSLHRTTALRTRASFCSTARLSSPKTRARPTPR